MFISDGQVRYGGYEEGYAEGRRTILSLVEASAQGRFGGLNTIATPLVSIKNAKKRSGKLFKHLYEELLRLHADCRRGRVLQSVRVRCHGNLNCLKSMGGYAERAAHQIEAICDATALNTDPRVTWWMLVAYGPGALVDLGIDAVIRSGMEEPDTLRLSDLDPHPGAALVGVTELGPEMSLQRFDDEIAELGACRPVVFETGYTPDFVEELLSSLVQESPGDAFTLVLPVQGSPVELAELVRANGSALAGHGILIEQLTDPARLPAAHKAEARARRRVLLVYPATFCAINARREADAWLLPTSGQSRACRLPHVRLGDANVHVCGSTPAALVGGLRRAVLFRRTHPPLHGGERSDVHAARAARRRREAEHLKAVAEAILREPLDSVEEIANRWTGSAPTEEHVLHWDLAAVRELLRARARGLVPREATWERAALGYAYTAVVAAYRAPSDADPTGESWESTVRVLAPIMMSVACTDEDVFERWAGETAEAQWERCSTAAAYLTRRALGDRYLPVPDVAGWERLLTVGAFWERLRSDREPVAHPRVIRGFFQAIAELYAANLRELDTATRRREVERTLRGEARSSPVSTTSPPGGIPAPMLSRSSVTAGEPGLHDARLELAALNDLHSTRASIAAGAVCRALAMMVPASMMRPDAIDLHERVAVLMDYRFRLANDLASLTDSTGGDRDHKENTWTVLVPVDAAGREREVAVARSIAACQTVLKRLDVELDRALAEQAGATPRLARLVSRAVHFGRRAYSGKHYSKLHLADLHRMAAFTLGCREP
ncbi:MAG: hypothetical protein IT372_28805 [Polyangiaceae bacterium]|nr:hypothetical protein [Polyangiaceae bacterium]